MTEEQILTYITTTYPDVVSDSAMHAWFFFYDPEPVQSDHRLPFATLVTTDEHDRYSRLNRPGTFRLNIGVSKATFQRMFGTPTLPPYGDMGDDYDATTGGIDFTVLNQVLPHPVYGHMFWVCILNPDDVTFASDIRPLLDEAYALAVARFQRRHHTDEASDDSEL